MGTENITLQPLVLNNEAQNKVRETYEKVCSRLKQMESFNDTNYKTTGNFQFTGAKSTSGITEIFKSTNIPQLVTIAGFVDQKESEYNAGAERLNLSNVPVFKWHGFSAQDWIDDIMLRINIINFTNEKKQLGEYKDKLSQFFTAEQKLTDVLADIQKGLSGSIQFTQLEDKNA